MKYPSLLLFFIIFSHLPSHAQSPLTLWYTQPADHFEESLVLGNGQMGASVFGGVASDKIYLNDLTLWSGEPVDPYMNPEAHTHVAAVREALRNEDYQAADSLNKFIQGSFSQSYAPLGTYYLNVRHQGSYTDYRRELNLEDAVSTLSYKVDEVEFTRSYFVSYPDKVMAIKLTASEKGRINASLHFESLLKYQAKAENESWQISGYAPYHAEPSYRGDIADAVRFDEDRGTRFATYARASHVGGKVTFTDHSIELIGCDEAVIYLTTATSFNGFDKNPVTEGKDHLALASEQLGEASRQSFDALKASHIQDYQRLFKRLELDLAATDTPDLPTDERLKRYTEGGTDRALEVLYMQYGRYLLISSSRTPKVPANLQGLWNPYMRPPWSSNYTLNINLEENYWLAETANLSELHEPLFGFMENLAQTGAITAKTFYGVGGWAACHNSDIWAMSNPVGDFGKGWPGWANWNMSGAWLCTHLWEHYRFTGEQDFLREQAWPLMRGAAQFCQEWMIKGPDGTLISSPSTSPENAYVADNGYSGATLYGATADLAMIRELFENTLAAAAVLGIQDKFTRQLARSLKRLHPYQVGKDGSLQEWYHDWQDKDPQHRHQTHLYGLHPGHHITQASTPNLAEACRKALEIKGDESTGWSKGWRINLWARLQDGNRAYALYRTLLTYVAPSGLAFSQKGGTYPNLLDAHPPFQIDGNFGGAAGVLEMLVQSSEEEIHLLPALPDAWPEGSIKGVCARGGLVLDLKWKAGQLAQVGIQARQAGEATLVFQGKRQLISLAKGERKTLDW